MKEEVNHKRAEHADSQEGVSRNTKKEREKGGKERTKDKRKWAV